jgi:DNA-binding GntR family transcriptional regulator
VKPLTDDQASLTDRVFEQIRAGIISRELEPGSLYSVVDIAEQLGVSRTPVREALLQFAANGMVAFERSRGVRILKLSSTDIEEIYELRLLLEAPSARRAASNLTSAHRTALTKTFNAMRAATEAGDEPRFQRHDVRFHETILIAAGNQRVVQAVANTRSQMHALGLSTTPTRTLADILAVHQGIYEAVLSGDGDRAEQAVRAHLQDTRHLLVQQSSSHPPDGPPVKAKPQKEVTS